MEGRQKGLSPFIATILLIALTVGVGSLMAIWFTSLTDSQTGTVSANSQNVANCASSAVLIESVKYPASGTGRVNVTVSSTGSQELKNLTITIAGGGVSSTTQKFFNGSSEAMVPGQTFATSIEVTNAGQLPPDIVTATALCQNTEPKRDECNRGESCMTAV